AGSGPAVERPGGAGGAAAWHFGAGGPAAIADGEGEQRRLGGGETAGCAAAPGGPAPGVSDPVSLVPEILGFPAEAAYPHSPGERNRIPGRGVCRGAVGGSVLCDSGCLD